MTGCSWPNQALSQCEAECYSHYSFCDLWSRAENSCCRRQSVIHLLKRTLIVFPFYSSNMLTKLSSQQSSGQLGLRVCSSRVASGDMDLGMTGTYITFKENIFSKLQDSSLPLLLRRVFHMLAWLILNLWCHLTQHLTRKVKYEDISVCGAGRSWSTALICACWVVTLCQILFWLHSMYWLI